MTETGSPYMTVKEAAAYLKRSARYIRIHKAAIGFSRAGPLGDLRLKRADLDRYVARGYCPPAIAETAPAPSKPWRPRAVANTPVAEKARAYLERAAGLVTRTAPESRRSQTDAKTRVSG